MDHLQDSLDKSSQHNDVRRGKKISSQGSSTSTVRSTIHTEQHNNDLVRLQKVLAGAGVASRRACEQLIAQSKVSVNGVIVTEQGMRIDPESAVLHVDGERIILAKDHIYLALNKPLGWQSTMYDDLGRPCIGDIVAHKVPTRQRIFHVGRLDANTEGLILLTNDGELAHRLMHPSYQVLKTYLVQVRGIFTKKSARTLLAGIELEDGFAKADKLTVHGNNDVQSHISIVIHEGRKHIVRRMFEAIGFPVTGLVRTQLGSVSLKDQRSGSLRVLNSKEIASLYELVEM